MNAAVVRRMLCAGLIAVAAASSAFAADPIVPSAFVSEALTHAPQPPADEKDAEMAAAGFTGMWMPVVMVYDRTGALVQAYNGPLDAFLAEPLAVGRLDPPLADGLDALLQQVGTDGAADPQHAAAFALAADQDYLILLLSPKAMKSACASCKFAPDQTAEALTTHAIRAKVVDVDLAL